MVILNCDGLSQFYFDGLLVFVRKFGNDDNTILYCAHANTSRGLMKQKRKNELPDNNFKP